MSRATQRYQKRGPRKQQFTPGTTPCTPRRHTAHTPDTPESDFTPRNYTRDVRLTTPRKAGALAPPLRRWPPNAIDSNAVGRAAMLHRNSSVSEFTVKPIASEENVLAAPTSSYITGRDHSSRNEHGT